MKIGISSSHCKLCAKCNFFLVLVFFKNENLRIFVCLGPDAERLVTLSFILIG